MSARELARRAAALAPPLVVVLFAGACLAAAWRMAAVLDLRLPLDPNEGWNAYLAQAAFSGRALYPAAQSYFVDNYPPLSFYLFGALAELGCDAILAGRIVSLLAFLAVSAGIARLLRGWGCAVRDADLAALVFMTALLIGSDYVGMNDPELLGHALDIAALLVLLRRPGAETLAALLFVAAFFVKHNLVAMPLAAAAWLALFERARAGRFAAAGAAAGLAGLLAFFMLYGSSLWSHLASARLYSVSQLGRALGNWLWWGAVPLALAALLLARLRRDRAVAFASLYAGLALAVAIPFAGGAGVDVNIFFDADIALALAAGLALDRLGGGFVFRRAGIALILLVPLAGSLALAYDADWREPDYWLHPMAAEARAAATDIAFLTAHKGPALCESLSLCYWAGKPPDIDVFNVGQEFAAGARSDNDLTRRIKAGSFAAVEFDSLAPFALTPRIERALLAAYRVDHADVLGVFLVPKLKPVRP